MAPSKRQKIGIALALVTLDSDEKKKRRKYWTKQWLLKRSQFSHTILMKELEAEDFKNFLRMDSNCFEELLNMVGPLIAKQDTLMRSSVSATQRLIVTLRYLATGRSYEDLKFSAVISPQLLSSIIPETCWAIYNCLKHYIKMPTTEEEWKRVANQFETKWNFSHCLGAMDGKHIAIRKPPHSGSAYYNYKSFFSVVLFAVVNANYEFMYVHTGTNGSISDGGVIQNTNFFKMLTRGYLNLPPSSPLPDSNSSGPYVFLGDSAFAISRHILKPYPFKNIDHEKRIFNYRLSRARRVSENAFGIMVSRFRVLLQTIATNVDNVDPIVLACCALHNYLRNKSSSYITQTFVDKENTENLTFDLGAWRDIGTNLVPLAQISDRQRNEEGKYVRNVFKEYFNAEGSVSFQENMLRVVPL
ncbi:putative nuclease HARBI1 [Photinus pyralis]|uniref:putative nuclease HARBI1 n=1 Tax=Photinus pyralis TaxID=7054 RepID=UPI0012672CFA|nr:putative nuclease HARBI1 [Photinus pyralis]XP_031335261.1 putative nuclease HARBI1 [Photinus pyralis]XP_031349658.1 putative nuclease HARBI1 [Photinus pyralis]